MAQPLCVRLLVCVLQLTWTHTLWLLYGRAYFEFSVRHDSSFALCVIIFSQSVHFLVAFSTLSLLLHCSTGCFQLTKYAVDLSLKGSPYWMAPEVFKFMLVVINWLCLLSNLSSYPLFPGFAVYDAEWFKPRACLCCGHMECRLYCYWDADWKTAMERIWWGKHPNCCICNYF